MTRRINRTALQNGDTIYLYGYRGIVSNLQTYSSADMGSIRAEGDPHSDHGACIQRYTVTSDPNDEALCKLPGGYNGGQYGGCIISDPLVTID